jgi:hypothetical protein
MPFIMEETFSDTVVIKIESYLLGMTFAVLTLPPEVLIEADMAPIRGKPSEMIKKQPFSKKRLWMVNSLPVPDLTLGSPASGRPSIILSYAHSNWLGNLDFLLLCPCPQLCLVLQVPGLCPQPIAAARAPKAIPFYEYFTYLASLLPGSISARANWLLRLVTDAYTFTGHFFITGSNLLMRPQ